MIVAVAFVVTTIPTLSYAAMSHEKAGVTAIKSAAPSHDGCAGHDDKKQDARQKSADTHGKSSKSCCDGMICKCIGSTCNSTVKIFGAYPISLTFPHPSTIVFMIDDRPVGPDLHFHIKRPPRA